MITNINKIKNNICLKCGECHFDMIEIKCMKICMTFCTNCFEKEFGHYSVIDNSSNGWKYWYKKYMVYKGICPNCGNILNNKIKICTKCTFNISSLEKREIRYHIKYESDEGNFETDLKSGYGIPEKDMKNLEAYIGGWKSKTNVKIISCMEIEEKI